jgi:hypothetical protein
MSNPLTPQQIARLQDFVRSNPQWSVFFDKRYGVFRVSDDDPGSDLYEENDELDKVLAYMTMHS